MIEIVLRPSEVQRAADCMLAWACNSSFAEHVEAAGYALNDVPLHVAAPIGSAVHRGCEVAAFGKIIARPARLDECVDAAVARFNEEVEERGGYGSMKWDATSRPSDAKVQIARMVKAWVEIRLPQITPVEIEHRRTITIHKSQSLTVKLSGQVDIGLDLPGAIHDLKTTAEVKNSGVQLGCYRLLREHVTGKPVSVLAIEHVQRVPMSKPQPMPRVYLFDADACLQEAKATLAMLITAIVAFLATDQHRGVSEPRLAFRANPSSPLCSRTWCAAFGTDACPISRLRIAA